MPAEKLLRIRSFVVEERGIDPCARERAVSGRRLGHTEIHLCRLCRAEIAVGAGAILYPRLFAQRFGSIMRIFGRNISPKTSKEYFGGY